MIPLKLYLIKLPELSRGFSPTLEGLLIAAEDGTRLDQFLRRENGTQANPEFWYNHKNWKFIGYADINEVQPGVLLVDWFNP